MLMRAPRPENFTFPAYLDKSVVEQRLIGNSWIAHVFVHEQQRLATVLGRRLTGHVISDRIAFALKVVMLACIPARLLPGIGDMFEVAEPPNDIAVPIDLNQIGLILKTMRWLAQAGAAKHLTVGQQFVRKAPQAAPQLNFAAVHIDQQGTEIRRWKNRVPIPRLAGVVHGDARWVDRRMAHTLPAPQPLAEIHR